MDSQVQGLGISDRRQSIQRVPVGSRNSVPISPLDPPTPFTPSPNARSSPNIGQYGNSPGTSAPGSANPLLSPAWNNDGSRGPSLEEQDITKGKNVMVDNVDLGYESARDQRSGPPSMNNDNNDTTSRFIRWVVGQC